MNIKQKMRRGGLCRCELSGLLNRLSSILSDNIPPPPLVSKTGFYSFLQHTDSIFYSTGKERHAIAKQLRGFLAVTPYTARFRALFFYVTP
ncbi:MAG: hypothetical protein LBC27_04800 [Spirochaetaceae bacterium]|jgi:hypothetical protein|nr:hypothetical protein [Spirochaetaceae bacterium]